MSRTEKIALIEAVCAQKRAMDAAWGPFLQGIGNHPDFPAHEESWRTFDAYVAQVSERIGDSQADWLKWFVWENDCGRKCLQAGLVGKQRYICTASDLVAMMEELG